MCLASYVEGYPLDLSILISGGKETKRDSPSNGERRGNSPSLNRASLGWYEMWGGGGTPGCSMDKIVFRQHILREQYKVIALFIVHVSYDSTFNCEYYLRVGLFKSTI